LSRVREMARVMACTPGIQPSGYSLGDERRQLLGVIAAAQRGDGVGVRPPAGAEDLGEFFEVAFIPRR
jgi:hypothetical protein